MARKTYGEGHKQRMSISCEESLKILFERERAKRGRKDSSGRHREFMIRYCKAEEKYPIDSPEFELVFLKKK